MNINTATNVAKANLNGTSVSTLYHNGKKNRMSRQSITTVALSLMIIAVISISTVSSAAAQSTTPDQIHDHQELAEYHAGTLSVAGPVMVEGAKPFDMIANRAELAAYQAYSAGQPVWGSEPVTVAESNTFDQVANRAELAAYQSYLAGQPTLSGEETDFVAMK